MPSLTPSPESLRDDVVLASATIAQQPIEVIHQILRAVISPRHLLPFTRRPLLHSTGHPRTKALPLLSVCRSWYRAGTPLLYRDILITRCSQLVRLLILLQKSGNSNRRFWIESIEIRDVLPKEMASLVFREGIEKLLEICPNLTMYAYQQSFRCSEWMLYAAVYPHLSSPITHLHLQWVFLPKELSTALLDTAGSLQSLCLSFAYNSRQGRWPSMTLSFPHLHTLSLPQYSDSLRICSNWDMPNLTRLLLWIDCISRHHDHWESHWGIDEESGEAFFLKFGAKLKVLEIYRNDFLSDPDTGTDSADLISQFLEHAPELDHLILHHQKNQDKSLPFSFRQFQHPNVKWIDIWADDGVPRTMRDLRFLGKLPPPPTEGNLDTSSKLPTKTLPPRFFPSAQGFRVFPKTLADWSHLPLIIAPFSHPTPQVIDFCSVRGCVTLTDWLAAPAHVFYDYAKDTALVNNVPVDSDDGDDDTTDSEWDEALEIDGDWDAVVKELKDEMKGLERAELATGEAITEALSQL